MEKLRPKVGSAVLVEKEGKFLLGKRNKKNIRGYWVIPGGGVKWREGLKEAGKREIKEETGLDIEITKFICHKEVMNLPEDYHTVVFFHQARVLGGNPTASDDVSEVGFFSLDEIKQMKIAGSVRSVLIEAGLWK